MESDATYTYDAEKRRIGKTVDSDTTKYFLDGANVIADYDGNNSVVATYITPGLDDNVSQTRDSAVYYYMKDGLGSVRTLTDSSEDTQNIYDYYAFGKELGSWTENVTNRYTYTAREYDTESEQYYYRARYYDGGGRFLSRDGLEPWGYLYVDSAPVGHADPTGMVKLERITIKKKKDFFGDNQGWGHWWIDVDGSESWGWWPKDPIETYYDAVKGVPGIMEHNDPYHTESPDKEYHPSKRWTGELWEGFGLEWLILLKRKSCRCATEEEIVGCIRKYSSEYPDFKWINNTWQIPGRDCHSFIKSLENDCCMKGNWLF